MAFIGYRLTQIPPNPNPQSQLLDGTKVIPGFTMDPFGPDSPMSGNTICEMPPDLYFFVRTVQLMRGITFAFGMDYSLAKRWAPYARRVLAMHPDL